MVYDEYKEAKAPCSEEFIEGVLRSCDKNGDGQLSLSELRAAFKKLGACIPVLRALEGRWVADTDGDGKVSINKELPKLVKHIYNLGMAIKSKCWTTDGKVVMTTEELKKWLKKFDVDKDGRLSKEELQQAIRAAGGRFAGFKSRIGVRSADANHNGFIDEDELNNLVEFAQKHLGVKIVHF